MIYVAAVFKSTMVATNSCNWDFSRYTFHWHYSYPFLLIVSNSKGSEWGSGRRPKEIFKKGKIMWVFNTFQCEKLLTLLLGIISHLLLNIVHIVKSSCMQKKILAIYSRWFEKCTSGFLHSGLTLLTECCKICWQAS